MPNVKFQKISLCASSKAMAKVRVDTKRPTNRKNGQDKNNIPQIFDPGIKRKGHSVYL